MLRQKWATAATVEHDRAQLDVRELAQLARGGAVHVGGHGAGVAGETVDDVVRRCAVR